MTRPQTTTERERVEGVFRSNGAALREGLRLADQLRREGAR